MGKNLVQFRAMVRKDWNQMKAEKCKIISEIIWSIIYGVIIGAQVATQIDNEELMGLGYLVLLLCCPVIFQQSCNYVANELTRDRQTRMKESLKIMGLKPWIYALSMLVQRCVWMIVPTLGVAIFTVGLNMETYSATDGVELGVLLWLFGIGMLTVTMVLQNFFTNPKLITMIMPFIYFIPTGLAMAMCMTPILDPKSKNDYIQYLFWFPQFPFTVLIVRLLDKSGQLELFEASSGSAWAMLIVMTPIYFLIHLYIEAIKPDVYGVAEHPCFCFRKGRRA